MTIAGDVTSCLEEVTDPRYAIGWAISEYGHDLEDVRAEFLRRGIAISPAEDELLAAEGWYDCRGIIFHEETGICFDPDDAGDAALLEADIMCIRDDLDAELRADMADGGKDQ